LATAVWAGAEGRGIFGRLTVIENLEVGATFRTRCRKAEPRTRARLDARLAERRSRQAAPFRGEQQMLAIVAP